jgi:hypothetical protein
MYAFSLLETISMFVSLVYCAESTVRWFVVREKHCCMAADSADKSKRTGCLLRCVECRSRGDERSKVYEDINLKAAVAASCTYHTLLAPFLYVATRCSLTAAVATWRKRETEVMYAREGLQQRRQTGSERTRMSSRGPRMSG